MRGDIPVNLKDIMAADIDDIFLDPDENAEEHDINGQTVLCIIDGDLSRRRSNRQSDDYDGIYTRQMNISVRESDLGYRPERDQKMTVDGEWYLVVDCVVDAGMLEITLGANRA